MVSLGALVVGSLLAATQMNWGRLAGWSTILPLTMVSAYLFRQQVRFDTYCFVFSGFALVATVALYGKETAFAVWIAADLVYRVLRYLDGRRPGAQTQSPTVQELFKGFSYAVLADFLTTQAVEVLLSLPAKGLLGDWLRILLASLAYNTVDSAAYMSLYSLETGRFDEGWVIWKRNFWWVVLVDVLAAPPLVWLGRGYGWYGQASFYLLTGLVLFSLKAVPEIQRERLEKERAEAARMRDDLTGLYNRIWYYDAASRWAAAGKPFTLCLLDVDHFKQINDRRGHLVGDEVLRVVARALEQGLPEGAYVARWGGEEFVLLLPMHGGTVLEWLSHLILRVKAETAGMDLGMSITMSGGLAVYGVDGTTVDELFRVADLGLYRAKEAGRARVCYAGADELLSRLLSRETG
jgi:diguanylate cyclase (GGDEF)-like protein